MRISRPSRAALRKINAEPRSRRPKRINLVCEPLEHRQLLAADVASLSQITAQPSLEVLPLASSGSTALTPQQIRTAYGVTQIAFSNGTLPGNGAGQTIAIIAPYNARNTQSDLAAFDSATGLPAPPSFTVD